MRNLQKSVGTKWERFTLQAEPRSLYSSFVDEPHSAIDGPVQGAIVNLTDRRAQTSRTAQLNY